MNERVVPLFENILDQRKNTKKKFINNEKKQLIKRVEDLEERSQIVKVLIQEIMDAESSVSTESSLSSNKILELLAYENQLLAESIKRVEKQRSRALAQSQESEVRAKDIKKNEKPLKVQYSTRIQELQDINKQKESTIQKIDEANSTLYEEIKKGAQEIRNIEAPTNKLELLVRKKQSILEIIREIQEEISSTNTEIGDLSDTYRKLYANWQYLNSLLITPKQVQNQLQPPQDTFELTRDEFWRRNESIDLSELLREETFSESPAGTTNPYQQKKEKWEKEFEKQFIKLETLREELNSARRLNEQLKLDRVNLKSGLMMNEKLRDSIVDCKQPRVCTQEHLRSNSNPFDYVIKPAFTNLKREASDEFNFSNFAENQSEIASVDDESVDTSVLDIFT